MNKSCENYRDWIADSLNGTLPDEPAGQLADHIRSCPQCAKYETSLRHEDDLATAVFQNLESDLDRQQQEVIKAVEYFRTSPAEKIASIITDFINKPVIKFAFAAAVIVLVTVNSMKVMGWLYELQKFMDCAAITVK